jgi:hypothetical protein
MHTDQSQSARPGNEACVACLDVRYRGQALIAVRGTITGTLYQFSGNMPVRPVDVRDARFLLASRLFTIYP